ncbi:hypothetical protein EVAR_48837_1 [Eumeta japonica]|uniref:SWIM-type domain-containing protein n=1 Tax=Eumeta variegata TaxID=151549 RepID=A0A4C1YBW8_EUMVA|nr:hypothetical protein EVAR_48837_1 [Eumeta japonica]
MTLLLAMYSYIHDEKMCTVKGKICPELKVHAKLYAVTLIVDEEEKSVVSVEYHGCVTPKGGCKHIVSFLMWTHRRSEEPPRTTVACYWKKSKLSRVGTSLKYTTVKDLSNGTPSLPSDNLLLNKFLHARRKKKLANYEMLGDIFTIKSLLKYRKKRENYIIVAFGTNCAMAELQRL